MSHFSGAPVLIEIHFFQRLLNLPHLFLRGKGLPELHSTQRGDQLVRVHVHSPERLSKEERELIEKLAQVETKEKGSFGKFKEFFTP